ncbi:hypothetical protein [Salinicola halophyticus]|uniref:hypothetical protein n=1 Tax=Salinicola halophyticus TaxID=1808881 RepID=UPI000DA1E124|nr:hypothetical protein [Salinicola halophyticus]
MNLKLSPQRSDLAATFSASGTALTVTIGETVDTFDFTDAPDGTFDEFSSDVLPVCPLLKATKNGDEIVVWALGWYGPAPERDWQQTPVMDDDGEIVEFVPEPLEEYQVRLADWETLTQEREVTL